MNVDPEAVIARAKQTFIDDHISDVREFVMWLLTGVEDDE